MGGEGAFPVPAGEPLEFRRAVEVDKEKRWSAREEVAALPSRSADTESSDICDALDSRLGERLKWQSPASWRQLDFWQLRSLFYLRNGIVEHQSEALYRTIPVRKRPGSAAWNSCYTCCGEREDLVLHKLASLGSRNTSSSIPQQHPLSAHRAHSLAA